jgi:hypothetical protein
MRRDVRGVMRRDVIKSGAGARDVIRSAAGGGGGHFQALEEESDFPDFITGNEDVPTKDAAAEVTNN